MPDRRGTLLGSAAALSVVFALAACPAESNGDGNGANLGNGTGSPANGDPIVALTTDPSVCGDGLQSGFEQCESGDTLACSDMALGSGAVTCDSQCRLDVSQCSETDLCAAWGYYNDGYCDVCELLGGTADSDCEACAADGFCAEWIDDFVLVATCRALGTPDPDCGQCGDGVRDGTLEWCDNNTPTDATCSDYRFSGGELRCGDDCTYDMGGCTL